MLGLPPTRLTASRAIVSHRQLLHTGSCGCGASGDRGAIRVILLNGITPGVSPMRLPQHPMDHAHKRARKHHWAVGLGPWMLPRAILRGCDGHPVSSRGVGKNPVSLAHNRALTAGGSAPLHLSLPKTPSVLIFANKGGATPQTRSGGRPELPGADRAVATAGREERRSTHSFRSRADRV